MDVDPQGSMGVVDSYSNHSSHRLLALAETMVFSFCCLILTPEEKEENTGSQHSCGRGSISFIYQVLQYPSFRNPPTS